MMHLETKAIGELLLDMLADYGAAYAGRGMTEELSVAERWVSPAQERFASASGRERAGALDESLFCKI